MHLVLRALSLNEVTLSQPIVGRFDERGGTIGRSNTATLALPDAERLISRIQANVMFADSRYWLEDVSRANAVIVNGRPLGFGARIPLKQGDELRIGGYRLAVELDAAGDGGAILRARGNTAPREFARAEPGGGDVFADLLGPSTGSPASGRPNVFADLLTPTRPLAAAAPAPPPLVPEAPDPFADLLAMPPPPKVVVASEPVASQPAVSPMEAPAGKLPDNFDPFADLLPPAPGAASGSDPLRSIPDSFGGAEARRLLTGLGPADSGAAIDRFLAPNSAAGDPKSPATDPFALLDPDRPAPAGPPAPNHVPELKGAYTPPRITTPRKPPPAAQPRSPAPVPAAPARDASAEALWAAFFEGTGTQPPAPLSPEVLREAGRMLRYVTEGLVQLMTVRAATKNELRADITVIRPHGNNPLKLSPDARAVLSQLLAAPARGFLAGPAAMREATNDLQSHLIGMMAGMRAALSGVLERFEPGALEDQMERHAFLDGILPGNRKARLWDVYREHYETIHSEAAEGFHRVFGKAFVEAYEEQVSRLEQGRNDRGEGGGR